MNGIGHNDVESYVRTLVFDGWCAEHQFSTNSTGHNLYLRIPHPMEQQRFLIGVAETYDVLIKTPPSGAYELRATVHDASGYASIWLGNGQRNAAPNVPKPNLYETAFDSANGF